MDETAHRAESPPAPTSAPGRGAATGDPTGGPSHLVLLTTILILLAFSTVLTSMVTVLHSGILLTLLAFFIVVGRRHPQVWTHGWSYILIGVNLIAFGGLLDLMEEMHVFQSELTSGHSRVFLQGVLSNTLGFLFLTFGLYRWVPSFLASTTVLHRMVTQLTGQVESQADQIRKNEELLRLQSLNRTILESVPLGLVATGEDHRVLHVNRAAERLVGQDEASMVGLPLIEAFRQPALAAVLEKHLAQGGPMSAQLEDLDLPAGPTTLRVTAARSEPGPRVLVLEDVTQNVKTERAEKKYQNLLIRNERLATLAGLISGVAHELNNPLSIIVGYTDLLVRSSPTDPAMDKPVRAMERAATRCLKIVKGLLNFAHQTQSERLPVRVNELLSEAIELIAYQVRVRDIDLETDIQPVPLTLADGHQLLQVFFNLLNNAYQALETSERPRKLRISCAEHGGLIRVVVEDTGPGIAPDVRDKIFLPFFTTKEAGVGTGLGLSICSGIVKSHGGEIHVESEVGVGSSFICRLPVVHADRRGRGEPGGEAMIDLNAWRILVVDDEEGILEFCEAYFTAHNAQLDVCCSGAAALDLISRNEYDLILSDIRMPGLNGKDLYKRITTGFASMADKVVFMTGDTADEETLEFLRQTGRPHLFKPFPLPKLEELILKLFSDEPPGVPRSLDAGSGVGT